MYIDILILSQILNGPKHGYEIKRNIERALGGNIAVNNNMLYPGLKRFEDGGIVRKVVVAQKGKPSRTVYHATQAAKKQLKKLIVDFPAGQAGHPKEFFTRAIFLGMLTPPERRRILAVRKVSLEKQAGLIDAVRGKPPAGRDRYFRLFMDFVGQRIKHEILWISKLENVR